MLLSDVFPRKKQCVEKRQAGCDGKRRSILGFLNHNLNLLLNLSDNDGIKIKNKITIKNQKLTATSSPVPRLGDAT